MGKSLVQKRFIILQLTRDNLRFTNSWEYRPSPPENNSGLLTSSYLKERPLNAANN